MHTVSMMKDEFDSWTYMILTMKEYSKEISIYSGLEDNTSKQSDMQLLQNQCRISEKNSFKHQWIEYISE